ncbi:nucleolar and coiled-body phosphoprotein 1-like isoform X2 [Battus philenor]|uniref:nucleolar and coiled-body phosphoprotein 1-like isoform X2 n=1 Tax=Battus philenor TaxID=42288 RepID=UPI0035D0D383
MPCWSGCGRSPSQRRPIPTPTCTSLYTRLCRPVYKEFDEWPQISLEPDPPKEKKDSIENLNITIKNIAAAQKMTRKSRPRIKEREEKETKGGYCEMCNTDYVDAATHRRSPHHLAFVRDRANFIALDSLISSGADVSTFLDKATPVNGERRSLRKLCNGDAEPKTKRSKRSQSHESAVNGNHSPKRNGGLDDEKKHNTRCSKRSSESQLSEDRQYYKVVGVSTKLRSSGGFTAKRKDSPTACNGTKPLVVKFKKIRRSELSVLSDEAEQFMFPKRASSTSSTSSSDGDESDDGNDKEVARTKRKTPPQPPPTIDRQRLARPVALKEESSEEDSWSEDHRKPKRRAPVTPKRGRRMQNKIPVVGPPPKPPEPEQPAPPIDPPEQPGVEISPLREEPTEKCMKWEDGRLKYTPAVENLEFAFESVPQSEPWFETFKRQDQDKVLTKNVPQYFALYSKSPKLPYEIGQLPPLKPNCCPLSDIGKREERPGPSRSYGTRGMKKQKIRKRTVALMALEHPRKSPREHASTLAILGSAGLLQRRKHAEDAKSTASEDTVSDTHSNAKVEPVKSETQEASERMQQFLSEVFDDAAEYDVSDEVMEGDTTVTTSTNIPDVSSLVSECDNCDIIRNEIKQSSVQARSKKGKFKKKNKTGWPSKRKQARKSSRNSSMETEKAESLDRSSIELPDDETTQDTIIDEDLNRSESEKDDTVIENKKSEDSRDGEHVKAFEKSINFASEKEDFHISTRDKSDLSPVKLDLKVVLEDKIKYKTQNEEKECKRTSRSSASETEDRDRNSKKKRPLPIGDWLQPIVRVSRMEPNSARRLRSAGRARSSRYR